MGLLNFITRRRPAAANLRSRAARPSHRLARIEPLEPRRLLSLTTLLDEPALASDWNSGSPGAETSGLTGAEAGQIELQEQAAGEQINEAVLHGVLLGVWTDAPIDDLMGWVESQAWPDVFWDVDPYAVKELIHIPLSVDPRGGYRTILEMHPATNATTEEAFAALEALDFVDFAKLESESTFRYTRELQEAVDRITKGGSQQPIYLAVSTPVPAGNPWTDLIVSLWTPERIPDVQAFVDMQRWPESLGRVSGEDVEQLLSMPLFVDPRGGYRTIVSMRVPGDFTALEQVPFVDFATLEAESGFRFTPRLQESMDAVTKGGSQQEVFPALAESGPLINVDDFHVDPRFEGMDGAGYATVIVDTGIDLDHPFFGADANGDGIADRIVYQYDFADDDADASDVDGHGTHVASIVASEDGTYTGMAPAADIIPLKVFTDAGQGSFDYVEDALRWVLNNYVTYNIASVNMSLSDGGNYQTPQALYNIDDEIQALADARVVVVSASGNSFYTYGSTQGVGYPAADPNSLSVGAVYDADIGYVGYVDGSIANTTAADRIAPFSQRDETLTTVMAPGAAIMAAGLGGGTATHHGTSQAAPHVAGIALLAQQLAYQEFGRRLTQPEFIDLLQETGTVVNDGDDEDDNVTNTGLDFPRVDLLALRERILDLHWVFDANDDPAPGDQADDGTADTFVLTRNGNNIDVNVNGSVVANIPLEDVIRISINGSSDDDSVTVNPLGIDFHGNVVISTQNDAGDAVYLYDSTGDDEVWADPGQTTLKINSLGTDPAYTVTATGYATIAVEYTSGSLDTAYLYDSTGDDHFYADPDEAVLSGTGYELRAVAFPYVHAYALAGGTDTAEMYDSPGDDSVYAYEDYTKLIGETNFYFRRAKSFQHVTVYALNGPDPASPWGDAAYVYDSADDDEFTGNPGEATMDRNVQYTPDRQVLGPTDTLVDFDYVHGYALSGGIDTAFLYDSPGDDRMISDVWYAKLFNQDDPANEFFLRAKYFEYTHSYALAGGYDYAQMYDSNRRDSFYGSPTSSRMVGVDYRFNHRARYFDAVYAYSVNGGQDVASMDDAAGAKDHLEAAGAKADPGHWGKVYSDAAAALQYFYYVEDFDAATTWSSDPDDQAHDNAEFQKAIDPVIGWLDQYGWL